MGPDQVDYVLNRISNSDNNMQLSLLLDSVDEEILDKILENQDIQDIYRAKIVVKTKKRNYLLNIIEEIGYSLTGANLFPNDYHQSQQRQLVFQDLLDVLLNIFSLHKHVGNLETGQSILYGLYNSLISMYNSFNVRTSQTEIEKKQSQILSKLTAGINDPDFVKNVIQEASLIDRNLTNRLRKQLALLYSNHLIINEKEGHDAFKLIMSNNIKRLNIEVDIHKIPFDILLDLLDFRIISDMNKLIISEISNQVQLEQLYQTKSMESDRDLIVDKLGFQTILRLIQEYEEHEIIHYIKDKEKLVRVFYEIDKLDVKAGIAKLMDDADIAFQVIETYFDNPQSIYMPKLVIKNLLLKLSRKQLAILRMTSPSEYQQLILQMVEDKRKMDEYDNAMFL